MTQLQAAQEPRVDCPPRRVTAVIPCFNRPADLERLLADLDAQDASGVDLRVLIIDNASDPPLEASTQTVIRSAENRGGSGGFNLGLRHALADVDAGLIWLLDSDARLHPGALGALLTALEQHPGVGCVGSALAEPGSKEIFEAGGFVDPVTGEYAQPLPQGEPTSWPRLIPCDYVAACSMLVRREVITRAGLMPEVFINGDDVGFCLAMRRRAGVDVACVPESIAYHPTPDKMRTWARYYTARNAFANIDAQGLGGHVRCIRAMREVGRAVAQTLVGRDDLAELHLAGLADAARGQVHGKAPDGTIDFEPFTPWDKLPARYSHLPQPEKGRSRPVDLLAACGRLVLGPRVDVGAASARAQPEDWLAARTLVIGAEEGFVVRRISRRERIGRLAGVLTRGCGLAARLWARGGLPPAFVDPGERKATLALSIIVLSYNRIDAVRKTLATLLEQAPAEIILVDNASTDDTPAIVREAFPGVRVIALERNLGVEAFNTAAGEATGDVLLILDDDAAPGPGVLDQAMTLLAERPEIAGVALHPRHPATSRSEWPFATTATDDFPFMGCGNLVRVSAWRAVGGYEAGYFLYRNDTDLAMSLLDAGWKVHFNPEWVVWHDSPAAAAKSARWYELATRNWMWMIKRHGRGPSAVWAMLAAWAWAHKTAGLDARLQACVLRGALSGLLHAAPARPEAGPRTGWPVRRMLDIRSSR